MSWGTELWDQYDNISKHTEKGIEFCDIYSRFIKERSDCELAYAKSLRKLVKNFTPKKKYEDSEFSLQTGFQRLLAEVNDLAGQHESISEKLADEVAKSVLRLAAELRHERKTFLTEGDAHSKSLQVSLDSLDKSKRTYEKAFKESSRAVEQFHKADADLNLSRADVERSKNVMHSKKTICDDCKSAYAKQLELTNTLQRDHYSRNIPSVFQSLQQLDEKRIREVADTMRISAEVHLRVLPIIQKCLDGMVTASTEVNPVQDSQIVIGRYKSGFNPPGDIPFEDLSNFNDSNNSLAANNNGVGSVSENSLDSSTSQESPAQPSPNKFGTLGKGGTINKKEKKQRNPVIPWSRPKKGEESEDFKHLPPTQRQKRLQTKIDALHSQIKKEAEERDAMTRMHELYTKNPNMGDAAPLVIRLAENQKTLDALQAELTKFQGFMHEVETQLNKLSNSNPDLSPNLRHSPSDLSIGPPGSEIGQPVSGGASSTPSENTDPGEAESSTPPTPQPPHHLHNKSLPHRPAPQPPVETASEQVVDAAPHSVDPDGVSDGSSSGSAANYEPIEPSDVPNFKVREDDDQDPEPPSYPPPPPPPEEDECEDGSAQDVDQSSNYSPESGYIGDPGDAGCLDEEPPAIAKCRALYSFQADNAGTIHMEEGEELDVVEEDQGDGWTRVRRPQPRTEADDGFVPTSYLELDI